MHIHSMDLFSIELTEAENTHQSAQQSQVPIVLLFALWPETVNLLSVTFMYSLYHLILLKP